jgi:hypothetical protein
MEMPDWLSQFGHRRASAGSQMCSCRGRAGTAGDSESCKREVSLVGKMYKMREIDNQPKLDSDFSHR